jgi:16S rRNA processing protein RimM
MLIHVGTVKRVFGTEGAVLVAEVLPRFQGFHIGATLQVGYSETFTKSYTIAECAEHGERSFVVTFSGITTPETASTLKEMGVFADEAFVRSHSESAYLESDIVGCVVHNAETGERLGEIVAVWYMPASDIWVVNFQGKELPIPAVEAFIQHVDISAKRVDVLVIDGLLDLAE